MKFLLFLMALLPALNCDPDPAGPHGNVLFKHTVDIQGRVGCSTNGAFLPMSAVQVYLSEKDSLTDNYLDMPVSNEEGHFRTSGVFSGFMNPPHTFIGVVLSCDALAFEKQFAPCNLSCPSGKAWLVRKLFSFSPSNGHIQKTSCQLDLDLAQGTVVDHDKPQELLPTVYVPREQDKEARPTCNVE